MTNHEETPLEPHKPEMVTCRTCKGANVETMAWVNPNSETIVDYPECGPSDDNWCHDCDENVELNWGYDCDEGDE